MTGNENAVADALVWLNDPLNWTGPDGIPARVAEHLTMSVLAVLLAALIALPLGVWLGHRGRGGSFVVVMANTSRALPTFALLLIFASTSIGFGNRPVVLAAAIFAIPPILTNAFTGLREVDRDIREAARGMGMSGRRSLALVEIPLALPLIGAGLRTAAVQVIATVPLAGLVGGGGLGPIIISGLATRRFGEVLAGGFLVIVLCLAVEALLAGGQRLLTPRPMRTPRRAGRRATRAAGATGS
ncbi:ABC transporter permease [Pengzhenrongella sicca]|uniref:ABC transporter permease subunit n=1 Tax=Pengzhenrongella sicca TaxID=2819238 RepID=A0A8A4ZGA2_9MICO|nr:ABC transporter permease subunit [Pengzhenrongella sicca]QTE30421.1 ABC transporter permease subunit [Pengzhenrongella sicca]